MEDDSHGTKEEPMKFWYDDLQGQQPFKLEANSFDPDSSVSFRTLSIFPWDSTSLTKLWNGEFAAEPAKVAQWCKIYNKWHGVVAVGGGSKVRLFLSRTSQEYLPLLLLDVPDQRIRFGDEERLEAANVISIAWCMVQNADEFWPLVAFSANATLYLFNVEKGTYHGILRGHGGRITSIAVHPVDPCILASTSYDYTCRIYDITKKVECKIDNPHWPGRSNMALAGAPFGLRSNESEGIDYGRCTAILVGGPSGGHLAPVLGAAFHPLYPFIATCGMDHAVKLWRLPVTTAERISREDKPLFSSTIIHDAQVLSITWMSKDILTSSCGRVVLRSEEASLLYTEPGTLVLWKWLGFERFFPEDRTTWPAVLRGCSSDYQESSSYKVFAKYNLPQEHPSSRTFVFQTPLHTPLIALPSLGCVYLSSVQHFEPRLPPLFVPKIDDLATATDKLTLNASGKRNNGNRELPCWTVKLEDSDEDADAVLPKVEACAIAENGRLLIGVGEKEGIWIWRIPRGKQFLRGPSRVTGDKRVYTILVPTRTGIP